MPDSERQARTPRIMRFPQPHDPDGRPCLPTNHPRSQPPWPTSPTPTPSKTVNPRTCWPTSPASPTRERPVAGATRWSPSWAWPPPRCWPAPGLAAIAEWAADAPQPVRAALGARRDVPGHFAVPAEATIRRTLSRLDVDALAVAVGAWLADRDRGPGPAGAGRRRAVAVDGKTLHGAHPPDGDGRPVHLLAAMDHTSRAVLAQHQVGGAPEEVPAFAPLLAPLDLAGAVVTADALRE